MAIEGLRTAGELGDAEAVGRLLADEVVFHSPLTDRVTFVGRDEVVALHRDIFAVLADIRTSERSRTAIGRRSRSGRGSGASSSKR